MALLVSLRLNPRAFGRRLTAATFPRFLRPLYAKRSQP